MLVVICSDPLVQRSGPARLGGGEGSNCEYPGHYSSNSPLSDHLLPGHNIHNFFFYNFWTILGCLLSCL